MAEAQKLQKADGLRKGQPFAVFKSVSGATNKGKEIVPAVEGKTPYVVGYQMYMSAAMDAYLASKVQKSGNPTQMNVTEHCTGACTHSPCEFDIPLEGQMSENLGVVSDDSGAIEMTIWGYYA